MRAPEGPALRDQIVMLLWLGPIAVVLLAAAVLITIVVRDTPLVTGFIEQFPGEYPLPESTPAGFPAWLSWQHFLNGFFLLLIVRTGWEVRTIRRPPAYWTRSNAGPLKTKYPPQRMSLSLWLHLTLDVLWIVNGVVYVVLLFASGRWARIIPTSWEVFPNALSAALQYASLDWPTGDSWVNYNSLQQLAYFTVVFVATPLAIVSGFRMSSLWNQRWRRFDKTFPIAWARRVHYPVMLFFVLFTIGHVALVFATGALRNLNKMYAGQDATNWTGLLIFAGSMLVMVAAWLLARPLFLRPIAALTGTVTKGRG